MVDKKSTSGAAGFGRFVIKHMLPVLAVVVVALAALWVVIQYFEVPEEVLPDKASTVRQHDAQPAGDEQAVDAHTAGGDAAGSGHGTQPAGTQEAAPVATSPMQPQVAVTHAAAESHESATSRKVSVSGGHAPAAAGEPARKPAGETAATGHGGAAQKVADEAGGHGGAPAKTYPVAGMAFVDAVIQPMDYELNQRRYGWRPNDIVEWTDNVNNFQLGVLEVTRRTSRILAERISRTGSTARFDPNLENAMNWFMIKADRYWFPSAESKYQDGLKELRHYYDKLAQGEAEFYTRTDNLIPLLEAYEDLLGSCDENLVKRHEPDGSEVGFFAADDYFFYAKGVASALYTILQAIEADFNIMVSREGGLEVLQNAIESCHHAIEIDPWIILNSDYSSIFANHRSNMAAPISHARFYLGVLIKALST